MPIKQAGYSHKKADARKNLRRQEADIRQAKYDALSIQEKLALPHIGNKEKAKLLKRLNSKQNPTPVVSTTAPVELAEVKPAERPKKLSKKKVAKKATKS